MKGSRVAPAIYLRFEKRNRIMQRSLGRKSTLSETPRLRDGFEHCLWLTCHCSRFVLWGLCAGPGFECQRWICSTLQLRRRSQRRNLGARQSFCCCFGGGAPCFPGRFGGVKDGTRLTAKELLSLAGTFQV